MTERQAFLYPYSRYYGPVKPGHLVFNANLQEFAQRVSFIANLQTGGKLSAEESYQQIQRLWHQLERSQHHLGIGQPHPLDEE